MSETYDKIYIRDLLWRCIIGLNDHERNERQDILVNIVLFTNLRKAGRSDNINDSVNYRTLKKAIITLLDTSQFFLIESLAEHVAGKCLEFDKVDQVKVTIDKPAALRFARSVAVEITRKKNKEKE